MFPKQVRFNQLEEVSASNCVAISQSIRPMALEGYGSNCFIITQVVGQKGNNKVSKCKLKKYLFGNKTKESVRLDCYSRTITGSVANQNSGFALVH